jgi:uncharacterized membrane protein HdeD (DUF308 family)
MGKTEKILSSIFTIALGVLLIVMKGEMISVFMTVLGIALIVLGIIELLQKCVTPAVIKIVFGGLIIFFGWTIVTAVVYIIAAMILIVGILSLYDCIRFKLRSLSDEELVRTLLTPVVCILIGLTLFFNQWDWIFVLAGILTVLEGGVILWNVLCEK